ncbi:hypothetical protein [Streptococcus agalactiae]|uniref:hypothetical protein n=1 Tax=Streptococcus agalactiae TaxID=1311 RepID=UPI003C749047
MTSWGLENFNNIYTNLSESDYLGRISVFPERIKNKPVKFNFAKDVKKGNQITQVAQFSQMMVLLV